MTLPVTTLRADRAAEFRVASPAMRHFRGVRCGSIVRVRLCWDHLMAGSRLVLVISRSGWNAGL